MDENQHQTPAESSATATGKRLESWKRIAAYLQRDVRTVKRWEKSEGLPVHRHAHHRQATVYAYEAELEAWRVNRRPALKAGEARGKDAGWRARRWVGLAVAAAAVLAAVGIGLWLTRAPTLPFAERDWVLISRFENRTEEEVFSGALEYALERELSNSRFVNVVPRERIADALQLMKKPLDTTVDAQVGREVCLRDGGIAALMTGRVEKLGTTYVLSAALVNPATGVTVASFSQEAPGQADVVPALRRLAGQVRRSLGEELASIEHGATRLEKATTPSLRALQLYSQADSLIQKHRNGQAVPLLEQALEQDPDFASAHILLAHSFSNLGRQAEASLHYQRAFELADSTTDQERYFIQASYYQRYLHDDDQAIESLELLLRIYPDHYWAVSNLLVAYSSRGQHRQALPLQLRRANLRPNAFDNQLRAAQSLLAHERREEAESYRLRARRLASSGGVNVWQQAWLRLYPAQEHWLRGDLNGALETANTLAQEGSAGETEGDHALNWYVGAFYLTLGRLRSAEAIFQRMPTPSEPRALVALGFGDERAAREYLRGWPASHRAAILLARTGQVAEAEQMILDPAAAGRAYAPFLAGAWDTLVRGELALGRGRSKEAIRLLELAVHPLRLWPTAYFFLGVDALAQAWEQQGNLAQAVEVLEAGSREKDMAIFWPAAPFFCMKNQLRLAGLYRRLGRMREADQIEAELRTWLALADSDYPILSREHR